MSDKNKEGNWLQGIQPDSNIKIRLFCFSYAGGGASTFLRWRAHFPKHIDLCAVQQPGREDRNAETPINDLALLIAKIADAIAPHINVPYAFFGHCNGALIAFELTRELRRRGLQAPKHIFVSSFRSPDLKNSNQSLHDLPKTRFISNLKAYGGMPEEILNNEEIIDSMMPTLRADFSLHETYRYLEEERLDSPMTILGGLQDNVVRRSELQGWKDKTQKTAKVKLFPGGHFFIDTHRQFLLKAIKDELEGIIENETCPKEIKNVEII